MNPIRIIQTNLGSYECYQISPECSWKRIRTETDHKFFSSQHLFSSEVWSPPDRTSSEPIPCELNDLLLDFEQYKLDPSLNSEKDPGHTGDLLDHSIWTYRFLLHELYLPDNMKPHFIRCIPSEYYPVLQLSGILHDIGKAGDRETRYLQKPDHPEQGWKYLMNKKKYLWAISQKDESLREYLETHCRLTSEEWSLVALISGLHYDLGNLFSRKISPEKFAYRLLTYIRRTKIPFSPQIVFRLIRAVTFADVWSQKSVDESISGVVSLPEDLNVQTRRESSICNWKKWKFEKNYALTVELDHYLERICQNQKILPWHHEIFTQAGFYECIPFSSRSVHQFPEESFILILNESNLRHLLEDEESPFSSTQEYASEKYYLASGFQKKELRQKLLEWIFIFLEKSGSPLQLPARSEILNWYHQSSSNKLSSKSIRDLIQRLSQYPRDDWSPEYIQMKILNLANPYYDIDKFIEEYDQEIISQTYRRSQSLFQKMMEFLSRFQPKFSIEGLSKFNTWEKLFEYLSENDRFEIPLLSPKGLMWIYQLNFGWLEQSNCEFDRLLMLSFDLDQKLFGPTYRIMGWTSSQDKEDAKYVLMNNFE